MWVPRLCETRPFRLTVDVGASMSSGRPSRRRLSQSNSHASTVRDRSISASVLSRGVRVLLVAVVLVPLCRWTPSTLVPGAVGAPSPDGAGTSSTSELPDQVIVEDSDDRKTPVQGGELILKCHVRNRRGEVQWTRDGFALGVDPELEAFDRYKMGQGDDDDFSLYISNVTLEDDAKFQCQVGRGGGGALEKKSKEITVDVRVAPGRPSIVHGRTLETRAGRNVELHCVTRGGKPKPDVFWYDDRINEEFKSSDINVTSKLMPDGKRWEVRSALKFTPTKDHDGQNLTCSVMNSAAAGNPLKASITLNVKYAPSLTLTTVPEKINEFDDVLLNCSAAANPSDVRYQWIVDGERVKNQEDDSLLLLKNVSRAMKKLSIQCVASNEVGTTTTAAELDVRYGPSFSDGDATVPRVVSAKEGADLKLECDADSNPSPGYEWTYGAYPRILETQKTLEILSVNRRKAGSYFCNVSVSGFAPVSKEYVVVIQGKPRIESDATQYGKLDEVVFVVCRGFAAPALTSVEWFFKGEKLQTSGDPHFDVFNNKTDAEFWSILEIFGASDRDFGEYNCSVNNELGSDSRLILLKPQRSLPLLTIVTAVVVGVVAVIGCTVVIVVCQKSNASHKPYDDYGSAPDDARSDMYGRKPVGYHNQNGKPPILAATGTTRSSSSTQDEDEDDGSSSTTNNKRYFQQRHQNMGADSIGGGSTWDAETSLYDTAQSNSSLPDGGDGVGHYYWPNRSNKHLVPTEDPSLLPPTGAPAAAAAAAAGPAATDPRYCALYGNPYLSPYASAAPPSGVGNGVSPHHFQQQQPPPPDLIVRRPADYITAPPQSGARSVFARSAAPRGTAI